MPLFPLNTVLFPGGPLRLRIFEPRYLDMVSRCMREDSGFGVALIVAGREAGGAAQTVEIGTLARIVDFEQLDDGLLGITARGERRFRILHVHQESDGLNVCQVEWRDDEARAEVPPEHAVLAELLRRALEQIGPAYGDVTPAYEDATLGGHAARGDSAAGADRAAGAARAERRTGAAALAAVAAGYSGHRATKPDES